MSTERLSIMGDAKSMTIDQLRASARAMVEMAGRGALYPRVPNTAVDLLKAAIDALEPSDHEVFAALGKALEDAGSYAELSRRVGISDEYVRQVFSGQRPPRGKLLAFLGFERTVGYRRIVPSLTPSEPNP